MLRHHSKVNAFSTLTQPGSKPVKMSQHVAPSPMSSADVDVDSSAFARVVTEAPCNAPQDVGKVSRARPVAASRSPIASLTRTAPGARPS